MKSDKVRTLQAEKVPSSSKGVKVDVLAWLARATLDVIGEAGQWSRSSFFDCS